MARRKKTSSTILAKAETRLAGLKSIDPKLDLGNGMSAAAFEREISTMRRKLAEYNVLLSKADEASNELELLDRKISDLTSRMLAGVAMNYGKGSNEYEMAGGVRTGDRRRRRQPAAGAEAVTA